MLTVLLPFRNSESTLVEAMNSIVRQSHCDFEVVAVDDHSEDGSNGILEKLEDPRIRILKNPGVGLVDALNYGMNECQSDWIVRMDSDDIMHPDRLKLLSKASQNYSEYSLIASRVSIFPEIEIQAGYREYLRWQNSLLTMDEIGNNIYVESPFAHPSVMFKKSIVQNLGGYLDSEYPEDYELWLRMFQAGEQMIKLPDTLLHWRDTTSRLSRTDAKYGRDRFDLLRARYLAMDKRILGNRPLAFWGAGRKTRKRSQLLMDMGLAPEVFIDIDHKKIGNRVEDTPVVDSSWLDGSNCKPFVLVYVTNHGARDEIGCQLGNLGYEIGRDWLGVG